MSDLSPQARVLSEGRPDLLRYQEKITASTEAHHGPELEAALLEACDAYRRLHRAYVTYLSKGGTPQHRKRSSSWSRAEAQFAGAHRTLTAAMAILYPHPERNPPFAEVEALIRRRVGPLCTGWKDDTGRWHLIHHPEVACQVHDKDPA
jgi:hypothetical protein